MRSVSFPLRPRGGHGRVAWVFWAMVVVLGWAAGEPAWANGQPSASPVPTGPPPAPQRPETDVGSAESVRGEAAVGEAAAGQPAMGEPTAGQRAVDAHARGDGSAYQLSGLASWYGGKFQGRLTANGERFDTNELTAAHRTLPFDTIVRVTSRTTGRAVVVRINDRGPFVDDRIIDLSRAAADIIGLTAQGVAPVELEILHYQRETDLRTLQIGSFSRRSNAQAMVTSLAEADITAAIETAAEQGVHRVIIQGVREADISSYRERLAALGYGSVLVRRK